MIIGNIVKFRNKLIKINRIYNDRVAGIIADNKSIIMVIYKEYFKELKQIE